MYVLVIQVRDHSATIIRIITNIYTVKNQQYLQCIETLSSHYNRSLTV